MQQHTVRKEDGTCPCGSGRPYEECCQIYHSGQSWPGDAESLVRSRYCAYVRHQWQYLVDTQLPNPQEPGLSAEELQQRAGHVDWQGLNIVGSGISEDEDERGAPFVNFYAYYRLPDGLHQIGEHSIFTEQDGKLFYAAGVELSPEPLRHAGPKIGRNDPCPCGSGKKYKKCCGKNA